MATRALEWRHACLSGEYSWGRGKRVVLQPMHHTRQMIGMHTSHILGGYAIAATREQTQIAAMLAERKPPGISDAAERCLRRLMMRDKNRGISQPDCNYKRLANRALKMLAMLLVSQMARLQTREPFTMDVNRAHLFPDGSGVNTHIVQTRQKIRQNG